MSHENDMAGTSLPPLYVVSLSDSFQAFNPPIERIILHLLEDLVCFAHSDMILYVVLCCKRENGVIPQNFPPLAHHCSSAHCQLASSWATW